MASDIKMTHSPPLLRTEVPISLVAPIRTHKQSCAKCRDDHGLLVGTIRAANERSRISPFTPAAEEPAIGFEDDAGVVPSLIVLEGYATHGPTLVTLR